MGGDEISELIDSIFAELTRLHRAIANRRQLGLPELAIQERVKAVGLTAPQGLLNVYRVCDGTLTSQEDLIGDIAFFPGFYWMSLENALEVYVSIKSDRRWSKGWLPIFANGGGDFYAVDCDPSSPDFGAVIGFVVEDGAIAEFQDLEAMLRTVERSYRQGAFFVRDDSLEADYPRMRAIARAAQPEFLEHEA